MNAAMWVTVARIFAIPAVMWLIVQDDAQSRWWAVGVYVAAAASDSLDGWLARSRGMVTVAGAFLDPLADKLLVTGALVALTEVGDVPAWAVMIILAREFAVTGLRLIAVGEGLVIPAAGLGKAKTLAQNAAIIAFIAPHSFQWINWPLMTVALVLTVLSGAYYFVMARRKLMARRSPTPDTAGDL